MALRYLALLATLLLALPTSAQRDETYPFLPGYVVLASGDTLRGEVQDRIDMEHARGVHFRQEPTAEVRRYTPAQLRGYEYGSGRRYVSRTVVPRGGPPGLSRRPPTSSDAETDPLPTPYFLQVLVDGELDLYVLHLQAGDERYWIGGPEGTPAPLYVEERVQVTETDGRTRVVTDRQYVRALARAFAACPEQQRRADRVGYKRSSLIRAVVRYNECVGAPAVVASSESLRRRRALALHLALRGGLGLATLSRGGLSGDSRAAPYIGALAELEIRNLPERVSIVAELALQKKGTTEGEIVAPLLGRHYDRWIADVSLGAQYLLPRGPRPYLGTGFSIGYLLGDKERYRPIFTSYYPPDWEGGFYAELGVAPALRGLPNLTLALRGEHTWVGGGPLGWLQPTESISPFSNRELRPLARNSSFSLVVGLGL